MNNKMIDDKIFIKPKRNNDKRLIETDLKK